MNSIAMSWQRHVSNESPGNLMVKNTWINMHVYPDWCHERRTVITQYTTYHVSEYVLREAHRNLTKPCQKWHCTFCAFILKGIPVGITNSAGKETQKYHGPVWSEQCEACRLKSGNPENRHHPCL